MPTGADLLNYGLPIASSVVNGVLGNQAVNNATGALTQGATQAINTISAGQKNAQDILNSTVQKQQGLLDPFAQAGTQDLSQLQAGLQPGGGLVDPFTGNTQFSFTPADLQNDPGYKFRLEQGLNAINAAGAAGGNRFSGATMKALNDYAGQSASQEYQQAYSRAENTFGQNYGRSEEQFRQNEATKLAALQQGVAAGQGAAGTESAALGQYGANTTNLQVGTSKAVADLQTQIASAKAAGDIAKANQLQGVLNGITGGVQQAQTLKALNPGTAPFGSPANPNPAALPDAGSFTASNPALETNIAPTAGATGANLAAPAVEAGTAVAGGGAALAAAPEAITAPLGATGALAAPEIAAPALAEGAGEAGGIAADTAVAADASTGGLMGSLGAFMTNPWTIGIAGAALGAYALIKHFQVHPVADQWVQKVQNPFDKQVGDLFSHSVNAIQSGQMSADDAVKAYKTAQNVMQQYQTGLDAFSKKGDKEATVAKQAKQTFNDEYGENGQKELGAFAGYIQQYYGDAAWQQATQGAAA